MIKKITPLIFLISTVFASQSPSIDSSATESNTTVNNKNKETSIKQIAAISFVFGIIGGALATYSHHSETDRSVVFLSDVFSFLFGPFYATAASIFIAIALSRSISVATLLLPAYIVTPTFYATWLATYHLTKNRDFNICQ